MHIAFLIRSMEAGGAERATASLAEHMKNAGHKVSILCLTGAESFYPLSPEIDVRYLNMNDA